MSESIFFPSIDYTPSFLLSSISFTLFFFQDFCYIWLTTTILIRTFSQCIQCCNLRLSLGSPCFWYKHWLQLSPAISQIEWSHARTPHGEQYCHPDRRQKGKWTTNRLMFTTLSTQIEEKLNLIKFQFYSIKFYLCSTKSQQQPPLNSITVDPTFIRKSWTQVGYEGIGRPAHRKTVEQQKLHQHSCYFQ